ncbi:uncharacterized protein BDZ99DRAFT_537250 [Mytilinidion resinicola]|uniref:Uncharacterized protein n=1 Tax=Mytilinidion resinicola TaxID=574789 RepID=A0A6A6YFG6_9PEZI|nr:uncharacterized protein BDZ99DRAFT_537250 [Mytilinidion resinicola]KAF2807532.1 hypothetical protein BDZ99DRAFT_537250 [Mytilinidion resinicola]
MTSRAISSPPCISAVIMVLTVGVTCINDRHLLSSSPTFETTFLILATTQALSLAIPFVAEAASGSPASGAGT